MQHVMVAVPDACEDRTACVLFRHQAVNVEQDLPCAMQNLGASIRVGEHGLFSPKLCVYLFPPTRYDERAQRAVCLRACSRRVERRADRR